jgi:sn-glycerol 3-phosphate transport system ATP-binding protein
MSLIPSRRDGRDVLLGVRPEHLEPCSESEARMTVDIDLIEPLGSDTLVYGHTGTNGAGARVAVRLHQSMTAQTGKLPVRYDPAQAHYFDPQSGKRIEP